jgi:hypothetical protein
MHWAFFTLGGLVSGILSTVVPIPVLGPGILFGVLVAVYLWAYHDVESFGQAFAIVCGCVLSFACMLAAATVLQVRAILDLAELLGNSEQLADIARYFIASTIGSLGVSAQFCVFLRTPAPNDRMVVEMLGCAAAGGVLGAAGALAGAELNAGREIAVAVVVWQTGMAGVLGAVSQLRGSSVSSTTSVDATRPATTS